MKNLILFVGGVSFLLCDHAAGQESAPVEPASADPVSATPDTKQIEFEVRGVEGTPTDEYSESDVLWNGEKIWISDWTAFDNSSVRSVDLADDPAEPDLNIGVRIAEFARPTNGSRDAKDSRMFNMMAGRAEFAVFFDGQLVSVVDARQTIRDRSIRVPDLAREEAQRIAAGLLEQSFRAKMLFVKADWSKVDKAETIEQQLREALRDAAVSQKLIDRLPKSAAEILFAPGIAAQYSQEHFAEFRAWLQENDLLVDAKEFSPSSDVVRARTYEMDPSVLGLREPEINDLPFVTRKHESSGD